MIIFRVKSGNVQRDDIATLRGDMERESAALAVLLTLEEPSRPTIAEAKAAGRYEITGRSFDRIGIVTVRQMVEDDERLDIPMNLEAFAQAHAGESAKAKLFEGE